MSWSVSYVKGGVSYPVPNLSRCMMHAVLNNIGDFSMTISAPTAAHIAQLSNDTEITITAWNNTFGGYIKLPVYSSVNKELVITGPGYAIALDNPNIDISTISYPHADSTLSSGMRVVFTSQTFENIASDIVADTGITIGTVDAFGSISIRFENESPLQGAEDMAKYAGYDWTVKSDKKLYIQARIGSATSVFDFNSNHNCTIAKWKSDSATGNVYKVVVLGKGTGTAQIQSVSPHGISPSFSVSDPTKNKVAAYQDNSVSSTGQANQLADNLLVYLNTTAITAATFTSASPTPNVQLGDAITLTDAHNCPAGKLLRVMEITRNLAPNEDSVTYSVIDNTSKLREAQFQDFLNRNSSLVQALGTSSQGAIKTMTVKGQGNGSSTNKLQVKFTLPSEIQSTSDILKATLVYARQPLIYSTDSATGNGTQNSSDMGHSGHAVGSYGADVAGGSSFVSEDSASTGIAFASAFSSWTTITHISFGATHTQGAFMTLSVYGSETSGSYGLLALRITDGSNTIGSSIMYFTSSGTGAPGSAAFYYPYDTYNKTITVQGDSLSFAATFEFVYSLYGFSIARHSHPVSGASGTGTANINNPSHTNPINQGVYTPGGEGSLTLKADLNGSNVASNSGGTTYVSGTIDVTSAIRSGGIGNQELDLYPTSSQAQMSCTVQITYLAQVLAT